MARFCTALLCPRAAFYFVALVSFVIFLLPTGSAVVLVNHGSTIGRVMINTSRPSSDSDPFSAK
jgi:hypothetical protein